VARAGQRTALALHGLAREDLARGDWVLAPGSLAPSTLLTARIDVLADAPKPLAHRARVRFHLGSGEALGRVLLLEGDELAPGDSALAQLLLESPVVPARGDRFVLRLYSPMRTLAGGTVLEPLAERRKRGGVAGLDVEEAGSFGERVFAALAAAGMAARGAEELSRALGADAALVAQELDALVARDEAVRLPDGRVLAGDGSHAAGERVRDELAVYGKAYPLRFGPTRGELKARVAQDLEGAVFDYALAVLLADGTCVVRGDRVAEAPGRELMGKHAAAVLSLLGTLGAAGLAPGEMASLTPTLALSPGETTELVGRLLADGELVRVDASFVVTRAAWERAVSFVRGHFARSSTLSVGDLKEGLGLSRKWAVPLLEALDREGVTRREGNERVAGARLGVEPRA
jgi:selenocysteine-specific elongation factor